MAIYLGDFTLGKEYIDIAQTIGHSIWIDKQSIKAPLRLPRWSKGLWGQEIKEFMVPIKAHGQVFFLSQGPVTYYKLSLKSFIL